VADGPDPKRAKRLALIIIGALLVVAVPYGFAIFAKYGHFADFVAQTLDDPAHPPRWKVEGLTPEDCVTEAVLWAAGCPGEWVFCDGGFRRVLRECMASQDRADWCAAHADWRSTRFGYHECEARIAAAKDPARADAEDDYCGDAYRGLAAHCEGLSKPR